MKRLFPQLYILLSSVLLLTGCIKEDFSDCPAGIRVYITYPSTYAGGVSAADVDKMNLYAFDEGGILRAVAEDNNPNLSPGYYMALNDLTPGNYRLVTWGGVHEYYSATPATFIVGQTTFAEALLIFAHGDEVTGNLQHHLFHAHLPTAQVTAARSQRFDMELEQTTNLINLTTEGLPVNGNTYRLTIYDSNGAYKFDHSFAPHSDFKYTVPCGKDTQQQPSGTLTVLKLADNRHPVIELYNVTTQTVRYSADLVALLNARGVDYRTQHEFNVHLKFSTTLDTEVVIDGWQVTDGGFILK